MVTYSDPQPIQIGEISIELLLIYLLFILSLTISTLHFTIPYGFGAAARFDLNQRKLLQNHLHFSGVFVLCLLLI